MQLSLNAYRFPASRSQRLLTRRLLPLYIAAFSQGLVLWGPIEKVFLRSLGFDQADLGLMAACYGSLIPLLDLASGLLADRWSRKGVLMLASVASMLNALLGGLSHNVPTYVLSTLFFGVEVAFVLFALLFGVVSQRVGVFRAGWMVVGVALLAGALLVTIATSRNAQGLDSNVI